MQMFCDVLYIHSDLFELLIKFQVLNRWKFFPNEYKCEMFYNQANWRITEFRNYDSDSIPLWTMMHIDVKFKRVWKLTNIIKASRNRLRKNE